MNNARRIVSGVFSHASIRAAWRLSISSSDWAWATPRLSNRANSERTGRIIVVLLGPAGEVFARLRRRAHVRNDDLWISPAAAGLHMTDLRHQRIVSAGFAGIKPTFKHFSSLAAMAVSIR